MLGTTNLGNDGGNALLVDTLTHSLVLQMVGRVASEKTNLNLNLNGGGVASEKSNCQEDERCFS